MPDESQESAALDKMVADVVNRKRKPGASVTAVAPTMTQDEGNGQHRSLTPAGDLAAGSVVPLEVTGSVALSRQLILDHLVAIEQEISHIRFTLDLLFQPLRMPEAAVATPESIEALRKKAEAEADRRHAERQQAEFERKQQEQAAKAQAATFAYVNETGQVERVPAAFAGNDGPYVVTDVVRAGFDINGDWLCPDHGQSKWATSPKGRNYRKCPVDGCREFERAG